MGPVKEPPPLQKVISSVARSSNEAEFTFKSPSTKSVTKLLILGRSRQWEAALLSGTREDSRGREAQTGKMKGRPAAEEVQHVAGGRPARDGSSSCRAFCAAAEDRPRTGGLRPERARVGFPSANNCNCPPRAPHRRRDVRERIGKEIETAAASNSARRGRAARLDSAAAATATATAAAVCLTGRQRTH